MNEPVLFERDGGVATITLNRPDRLNALNKGLLDSLIEGISELDDEVRVVVLRGAGRAFSSGHDLKDAGQAGDGPYRPEDARAAAELMQTVTRELRDCPAPVVAVVHGYAIGGGAEIAFSCDLVIAASGTVFQFTETAVGLTITNGSSLTLPRTVGPFVAKELVMLGERFDADSARAHGLVNRVVDGDELDAEVGRVVEGLLGRAPLALRTAKRLLDASSAEALEAALEAEVEEAVELEMTEDAREATRAFVEGREPNFVGR